MHSVADERDKLLLENRRLRAQAEYQRAVRRASLVVAFRSSLLVAQDEELQTSSRLSAEVDRLSSELAALKSSSSAQRTQLMSDKAALVAQLAQEAESNRQLRAKQRDLDSKLAAKLSRLESDKDALAKELQATKDELATKTADLWFAVEQHTRLSRQLGKARERV